MDGDDGGQKRGPAGSVAWMQIRAFDGLCLLSKLLLAVRSCMSGMGKPNIDGAISIMLELYGPDTPLDSESPLRY
jgi:hypothetical protein